MSEHIFIIDTEQYAGNFARTMATAMTGAIGEYFPDAAVDEHNKFFNHNGLDSGDRSPYNDLVLYKNDDNDGSFVEISPTPGWFNHGMGGCFREGEEEIALKDYKEKCIGNRHPELAEKPLHKHTAFLSVSIFFKDRPSHRMMEDMYVRAKEFASRNNITVTNYRLIEIRHIEIARGSELDE